MENEIKQEDENEKPMAFRKLTFPGLQPDKIEGISGSSDNSNLNRLDDDDFVN